MAVRGGGPLKRALLFHIPLTVIVVATLFPFYWMVVTSIRPHHGRMAHSAPADRWLRTPPVASVAAIQWPLCESIRWPTAYTPRVRGMRVPAATR